MENYVQFFTAALESDMTHIILLVQPSMELSSRTFCDYDNLPKCLEGIIVMFQDHLKRVSPNVPISTYNRADLFNFIDAFVVFNCLALRKSTNTYCGYNRAWIKEKLFEKMNESICN